MTLAKESKLAAISELIERIQAIKKDIHEKHNQKGIIESSLNDFTAKYETFVSELRAQRMNLEYRIRQVRNQLLVSQFTEKEDARKAQENIVEEQPQPSARDLFLSEDELSSQPVIDSELKKKQVIRRHFARFWHTDTSMLNSEVPSNLMTDLNVIFMESKDSADMLAAIPWDNAWLELSAGESLGAQWERLMEWYSELKTANERLDKNLFMVKQHSFFAALAEYETYDNKMDYFSTLVEDERRQIMELEETLEILEEYLSTNQTVEE
jgi:hypothetical protein